MIHADDAESHRRRSFCVCTLSSLLVGGKSPWDSRMLVYVTDNQRCCNATWDMLDVWLCWSLEELQQGVCSGTDPWQRPLESRKHKAGLPIACGWKAVLTCHKGDDKYLQRAYHPQKSWVSSHPCWFCAATSAAGPCCYTLHGKSAPHRQTRASFLHQFV